MSVPQTNEEQRLTDLVRAVVEVVRTVPMKSKEELLREEIRGSLDMLFRVVQWAVTVMLSFQTAIFFIRRELVAEANAKITDQSKLIISLPWNRYLVGTFALLVTATVFSLLTFIVTRRPRDYRRQLSGLAESGIHDHPGSKYTRWFVVRKARLKSNYSPSTQIKAGARTPDISKLSVEWKIPQLTDNLSAAEHLTIH